MQRILCGAAAALLLAGCQSNTGGNQAVPAPDNDGEAANVAAPAPPPANEAAPANTGAGGAPVPVREIDLRNASAAEVATRLAGLSHTPSMEPGLWETTVSRELVSVTGMPPAQRDALQAQARNDKPRTSRDCVASPKTLLPQVGDLRPFGSGCSFARYHVTAGRFDVQARCVGPAGKPVSVQMSGKYAPTAVALDLDLNLPLPTPAGAAVHTRAYSQAKRIGECPGGSAGAKP